MEVKELTEVIIPIVLLILGAAGILGAVILFGMSRKIEQLNIYLGYLQADVYDIQEAGWKLYDGQKLVTVAKVNIKEAK